MIVTMTEARQARQGAGRGKIAENRPGEGKIASSSRKKTTGNKRKGKNQLQKMETAFMELKPKYLLHI